MLELREDRVSDRRRRVRRYIDSWVLRTLTPVLRYSYSRDAFVFRVIGRRLGPVLRRNRRREDRRRQRVEFAEERRQPGSERRAAD